METKNIGVKSYDGNGDPKEFKRMFELNFIMLNWDQTKKLTILPLLLTGKAARLFEAMKDEEKDSTDRIFEILISGCSQSAESMHQEFLDRAPLPEETVVDFARALQRLLEKAVPTLGSNERSCTFTREYATWDQLLQCLEETLPNVKASAIGHRSDGTMATQFKFESGEPERFKALFDGGATNSLIRFDSLSSKMQNEIKYFLNKQVDMNKRGFKKFPVTIKGVTSLVSEDCVVAPVLISIGSWSAIHSFVITASLRDKDIILGRDFLKKYGVVIDHSNDEIMIDENFCDLKGDWYNAVHQSPCVTVNHVVLEPRSESYVKCRGVNSLSEKDVMFTSKSNGEGVYWSHCVKHKITLKICLLESIPWFVF
ncbi:hypothetical protein BpHYR1_050661 [Brachionus plicatilis]|uniref:Uncharacterized protein n=1 Tax=Brachionus plicatilis TaxID=10195 RepID=A0A3M7P870_BRAPC|nr:hypothetical protein BpHYR1_050661 [Brachionus plicatilis]